jgi:hypothetical protein
MARFFMYPIAWQSWLFARRLGDKFDIGTVGR